VGEQLRPCGIAELGGLRCGSHDVGEEDRCKEPLGEQGFGREEPPQPCPVQSDAGLVSNGPAVVPGRDVEHVAGAELEGEGHRNSDHARDLPIHESVLERTKHGRRGLEHARDALNARFLSLKHSSLG
jgi:hypothetical protein